MCTKNFLYNNNKFMLTGKVAVASGIFATETHLEVTTG